MFFSVVKLLQITAFIIATVALFLNINAGVGLSKDQHIQLSIDVNILNGVPSTYPIYPDNVTVDTSGLRFLTQCTEYIEANIPVLEYFNTTIIINTTVAEAQLANLTAFMEGRGLVSVEQVGTVQIVETNATLPYFKEYITFGNSALHYIGIDPSLTYMTVQQNGTMTITFIGWSPSIGLAGSTGYNAIYDTNQLDIQSALPVLRVEKKQYLDNGAILLSESPVALNEGDVVSFVRRLQL